MPPGETSASSDIVAMSEVRFRWPRSGFAMSIDRFAVRAGERLLIIGPSGSGKSTFLSLMCGIVAPQQGAISVLGIDLGTLSGARRDQFRAEHFGIIFQMFNLLPYGSTLDNVLLPLHFAGGRHRRASEAAGVESEANRLFSRLGLDPGLAKAPSSTLSVGQQQRVAAARALIGRPELIVADEPTSSLDRNHQLAFLDLLFAEASAAGATLVVVSHDESLAARMDRVVPLADFARASRSPA
jgi:putative ABC transport system ATP-binding protein